KAAPRFAAWWKLQEPGKPLDDRLKFVKHLSTWLHERGWLEAATLRLPTERDVAAAEVMAGMTYVNKWSQPALFAACEAERGAQVPIGKSGNWAFPDELVARAKVRLGREREAGPPI